MASTGQPMRGVTLLEIMVVCAIGTAVVATATFNIVEQVKRSRAVTASRAALHPHASSRDRAVAARTCTETVQVPPVGQAFKPPDEPGGVKKFPDPAQVDVPRIAVIEWSDCTRTAEINRIDFYNLDGDISLSPYDTGDGRLVFGVDGGVTAARPGPVTGLVVGNGLDPCGSGSGGGGKGSILAEGEGEKAGSNGPPPVCNAQPPPQTVTSPSDVTFSATTYFGDNVDYRVYSRVGAVEIISP